MGAENYRFFIRQMKRNLVKYQGNLYKFQIRFMQGSARVCADFIVNYLHCVYNYY